MIAPGVIGAIALVLALFAMHILPVNFAGLLLIVVALGCLFSRPSTPATAFWRSAALWPCCWVRCMLIRSPLTGAGVSLGVALGVTLPCAALTIFLMRLVLRLALLEAVHRRRAIDWRGSRSYRGHRAGHWRGSPTASFQGMVRMHGELWRAVAPAADSRRRAVRVVRITGPDGARGPGKRSRRHRQR